MEVKYYRKFLIPKQNGSKKSKKIFKNNGVIVKLQQHWGTVTETFYKNGQQM